MYVRPNPDSVHESGYVLVEHVMSLLSDKRGEIPLTGEGPRPRRFSIRNNVSCRIVDSFFDCGYQCNSNAVGKK